MWTVAWSNFAHRPLLGSGAGTFVNTYNRNRPDNDDVRDAHSLYLETFDELGIVGVALLLTAIIAVLVGAGRRARGPNRPLYAALFAVLLAWAGHAGVDWDWEMPVLSTIFFGLGGLALSRAPADRQELGLASWPRLQVGIGCVLLAVAPAYVWFSEVPLVNARQAFATGDCRAASRDAVSSISRLGIRAEPYQMLAYCDVREGFPRLAISQAREAISLDPQNWHYTYSLALMQAAAGLDPRPEARRALALNPHAFLAQDAWRLLNTPSPSRWQTIGRRLTNQFTSLGT
jgi:O-Antigen ligase